MPKVEFIYDPDCPNVQQARTQLLRAFAEAGMQARWQEWDRSRADSPVYARQTGSPTILVNGRDITGAAAHGGNSCRVYTTDNGALQGVPSSQTIASALIRAREHEATLGKAGMDGRGRWRALLAAVPVVAVAALPKLTCPACWPAYAGLLSAMGLGFINYTPYLLPLTITFLAIALSALAIRAQRRHGYGPFALGTVAAALVLLGSVVIQSNPVMYAGIALLVVASAWNSWPRRHAQPDSCPACVGAESQQIGDDHGN